MTHSQWIQWDNLSNRSLCVVTRESMEEYSTYFKTGRKFQLTVAGYQEIGDEYPPT